MSVVFLVKLSRKPVGLTRLAPPKSEVPCCPCTPSSSLSASSPVSNYYALSLEMARTLPDITAAIALKIVVDMGPDKFRHSFYSQFVLIGTFLPLTFLIPESPCE